MSRDDHDLSDVEGLWKLVKWNLPAIISWMVVGKKAKKKNIVMRLCLRSIAAATLGHSSSYDAKKRFSCRILRDIWGAPCVFDRS